LSLSNAFCFLLLLCYKKARCLRDYDNYATCHVGKFEVLITDIFISLLFFLLLSIQKYHFFFQTVDTYYRHCSSAAYVGNVSVPLLCISALDDPVCTREAIPWDECRWIHLLWYWHNLSLTTYFCVILRFEIFFFWSLHRANPNIVLATPQHGGHLAFFEGLTASSSWYLLTFL
jgi:abhydrolase domain-containing protein 1/3